MQWRTPTGLLVCLLKFFDGDITELHQSGWASPSVCRVAGDVGAPHGDLKAAKAIFLPSGDQSGRPLSPSKVNCRLPSIGTDRDYLEAVCGISERQRDQTVRDRRAFRRGMAFHGRDQDERHN